MSTSEISFIPWLREGISTRIIDPGNLKRPIIPVTLEINGLVGEQITQNLNLVGPGDVKGINPAVITKIEPSDGFINFQHNDFPFIEFYDEFFPWRFSPEVVSNNRLTPWITLVVLAYNNGKDIPNEFEYLAVQDARLQSIKVQTKFLPKNPENQWAWAHAQSSLSIKSNKVDAQQKLNEESANLKLAIRENQDLVYSRLISSRILQPETNYVAFLIPTFELGRLTGIGQNIEELSSSQSTVNAKTLSYDPSKPDEFVEFPIYYQWSFKTGEFGDFESLVRNLGYKSVNTDFGKKPVDIGQFIHTLNSGDLNNLESQNKSSILAYEESALKAPGVVHNAIDSGLTQKFKTFLNTLTSQKSNGLNQNVAINTFGDQFKDDPIVTPTLYGKWHAAKEQLSSTSGWFEQLNLDPQYRIAANIGSKIVRENQEDFMKLAWDQIGEVIQANRRIIQSELTKQIIGKISKKYIETETDKNKVAVRTSPIQNKILLNPSKTVQRSISESIIPNSAVTLSFTKFTRNRSNISIALNKLANISVENIPTAGIQKSILVNLNDTTKQKIKTNIVSPKLATQIDKQFAQAATSVINDAPANATYINALDKQENFFVDVINFLDFPVYTPDSADLTSINSKLVTTVNSTENISKLLLDSLTSSNTIDTNIGTNLSKPILAYPKFNFPVYKYLSVNNVLHNFNKLENNSVTLLSLNEQFIESVLVGLNHEFMKELLWRGYPTDQRGTPFRNFWHTGDSLNQNVNSKQDIKPIHQWNLTAQLGTNAPIENSTYSNSTGKLVLVIKGDLLRRFPNTVIYAVKGEWKQVPGLNRTRVPVEYTSLNDPSVKMPLFNSFMEPDVNFIGFELTKEMAIGDNNDGGWFFVISERPGETRFGLDVPADGNTNPVNGGISKWDDLLINHFIGNGEKYINLDKLNAMTIDGYTWKSDSAQQAAILNQKPIMVMIHAKKILI